MSPYIEPLHVVNHPTLGRIEGISLEDEGVVQFRGIPFGSIPGRWKHPVLLHGKLSTRTFDATCFGPASPQGEGGQRGDLALVGDMQLGERDVAESETKCLNLVITRPARLVLGDKLPVLVWYVVSHELIFEELDLSKFVAHSVDRGKPCICVSINYRLGVFGFLASEQAGISGNFGLKDQACAFKWIKQNIEGFGGNADSITAFGESAGARDISARRPRSMAWQTAMLRENLSYLGFKANDIPEAVERLREMPATQIVQTIPLIQHWSPTLDPEFLTGLRNEDLYIQNTWCRSILIGDMAHDGTILHSGYLDDPNAKDKTIAACNDILGITGARRIRATYSLDGDRADLGMLRLISDLRFHLPVIAAGKNLRYSESVKVREYHMDQFSSLEFLTIRAISQPNPFVGAYHGLASHVLDIAFLFRNVDAWLDDAGIGLGKRMDEVLIEFAYRDDQKNDDKVLAIGPSNEIRSMSAEEYDDKYRGGAGQLLLEFGWDKCLALGERLQGIPFRDL
ncbi:Alpha/Beta hydrolase protein, partial [Dactylonectria macrodidyma]